MPTRELVDRVADMRRYYGDAPEGQRDEADLAALRSTLLVEIHRRCAMAAACIAFALLGVPLGIHTHRRQSSAGIVVSLVVMALFYGGMVAATSLARRPELHPHWLIWLPVALTAVGGAVLLRRIP
jgi:lipopolysaccharide export LptBFGC system permease protein LptF